MRAGFSVVIQGGRVALRAVAPAAPTRLPLVSEHAAYGLRALLMGRLYYRAGVQAAMSPAACVLDAYRRGGREALERLEGDFALAVVDETRRRLVAARDPMGGYPLFWLVRAGIVALATDLRPLVDLLDSPAINTGFLGEVQMLPFAEIDWCAETAFEGIARLVPGSSLEGDERGVRVHRFWDWHEHVEDPGTDDLDQLGEAYALRLRGAVAERLRGRVAVQVSGGMDSTAIALLARAALPADAPPLAALSLTYDSLPGLDLERPYLDLALGQPGLVAHRIPGDDRLDFDVFREPPPHGEPHSGLFRAGLDVLLLEAAQHARADTVMTGFGADEMLASAPFYLADLLKAGQLRAAWHEAGVWSHAHSCNPWRFLWPFGVQPLLPVAAQAGLGPALRGGRAPWRRQSAATIPPWVLPQFAREGRLRERATQHLRHGCRGHPSVVLAEALARIRLTGGDWARATLAAPAGIHLTHPFRDPRVLALGLGIRARVRPVPLQQKVVLARAMNGVLPQAILERRSKSHFNALYYRGLARNLPYLEELVQSSAVDEHGLFDKAVLLECLRDAAAGGQAMDGVIGLNNTLAIVRWLALLPHWLREPAS